jgi:hypothetical protein
VAQNYIRPDAVIVADGVRYDDEAEARTIDSALGFSSTYLSLQIAFHCCIFYASDYE